MYSLLFAKAWSCIKYYYAFATRCFAVSQQRAS